MNLYCLFDKKSSVAEYYLASCDEDALRLASVMMMVSRPIYEFAEDFCVQRVQSLSATRALVAEEIVLDCFELRRQLDARRKEREDAKA